MVHHEQQHTLLSNGDVMSDSMTGRDATAHVQSSMLHEQEHTLLLNESSSYLNNNIQVHNSDHTAYLCPSRLLMPAPFFSTHGDALDDLPKSHQSLLGPLFKLFCARRHDALCNVGQKLDHFCRISRSHRALAYDSETSCIPACAKIATTTTYFTTIYEESYQHISDRRCRIGRRLPVHLDLEVVSFGQFLLFYHRLFALF